MKLEYIDDFRSNLYTYLQADKYCDIILVSSDGKTRISAHRVVLAASSRYFADQISNSDGSISKEIIVTSIDGITLKRLVATCYSGALEVDENNVSSVYMGAIHLQLNALLPVLDKYITTQLSNSNCLHFHTLAKAYSRSVLIETTEKYICEHFIEICDRPSFLKLDAAYLNKLLALKGLLSSFAENIFLKVVKWIQHAPNGQRDGALAEFLPNLRLSLMSTKFLLEQVNPLLKTKETKDLVIAALGSKLETIPSKQLEIKRERFLVVAGSGIENRKIMEYSFEQQKWKTLTVLPITSSYYTVAYSKTWNSLCFVGVRLSDSDVHNFILWNIQTKKLKPMKLSRPRFFVSVMPLDDEGDLLVIGGCDGKKSISMVERWEGESGQWHKLRFAKKSKYWANLVRVGDVIYSIGGLQNGNPLNSVECYNINHNYWYTLASLNYCRDRCGVMYDGGKIYVVGGNFSNVIECYDLDKNTWTEVCIVPGTRDVTACVRFNGDIIAAGSDIVLKSNGNWKKWRKCDTIPPIDCVGGVFSIPPQQS